MGPAEKRTAEAVRRFGGEPQPRVVALRKGPFLAGIGQFPVVRLRLSGLRGAAGGAWGKFSGRCRARAGGPMGHGAERPLTPRQVTAGTMRKVWWRCALGHSWRAAVFPRVQKGVGCPYCAGRKVLPGFNDLASKAPTVAAQWHPALNGGLTPEMVTVSSHRRVWWQCPQSHVWKALVYSRTGEQKCGCPVCAGRGRAAARSVPPAGSYRKAQFFAKGGDK